MATKSDTWKPADNPKRCATCPELLREDYGARIGHCAACVDIWKRAFGWPESEIKRASAKPNHDRAA